MSRSVRVAPEHIQLVKWALRRNAFPSQKALAEELGISRSTTDKFFTGKAIDYQYFVEISTRLGLNWQTIAYIDIQEKSTLNSDKPWKKKLFNSDKNRRDLAKEYIDEYTQKQDVENILVSKNKHQECTDEERAAFIVTGSICKDDISKLRAIAELLQEITGDTYIKIVDIEEGSIKLILEGSQESLEQIEALFKTGKLTEVLKIPIENVQFVDEKFLKLKNFLKFNRHIKDTKRKKLIFTISGNLSKTNLKELKAVFKDTELGYPKKFSKQFFTDLNEIAQVQSWFKQLYKPPIPRETWQECEMILIQGFSNAVCHAHQGFSRDVPITVEITLFFKSLEIRIWDQGPGFNLKETLKPIINKISREPRTSRLTLDSSIPKKQKRGLLYMKGYSNHLSYIRTKDNRNCLLAIKDIETKISEP
jgi:anti-sigma regulatory factor (Ser/Thr protein kinase)